MVINSMNKKNVILLTGMTSLKLGAMEDDNLGNFIIAESMFRSLREHSPEAIINTTLQLSENFAKRYNINILTKSIFWIYSKRNYYLLLFELLLANIWNIFNRFGLNISFIFRTERLKKIYQADKIIDFHGDIFGDNALNKYHFLIGAKIPILSKKLNKKIFMVASSPGPFKTIKSLQLAKKAFNKYDHISVREPISLSIINSIGFVGEKYSMHPCFSFGFKPYDISNEDIITRNEPDLYSKETTIGIILCTHNMKEMPLNKWPRNDHEYTAFIDFISYIVKEYGYKVCIFSHRYKIDVNDSYVPGSDHTVINRLIELLPDGVRDNVYTINGRYNASTMNKIIGHFKFVVSGRIHGAVQALIQKKPVMILDYANEPRAHKSQGFAIMSYVYEYMSDPNDSKNMIKNFNKLVKNEKQLINTLNERIPELIELGNSIWKKIL